ncbi:hypothetical protein E2C01_060802 [Portunus trituberculatus]|uniref:Uncharacterized protein n=1 Tax=Portunus trituberculatus TaxID=210409 RepID=A0A5B7H6I5_PORTR|nr:hypothetical protein [Portunus trituberculatus]
MDAIAELRRDMNKLKEGKCSGTDGGEGDDIPTDNVNTGRPMFRSASPSTAEFSGFTANDHSSSNEDDEGDTVTDQQSVSVLQQCAKVYGPVDAVAAEIDGQVADMVNHVFDNGLREEKYKEILEDDATKRSSNCEALSPVEWPGLYARVALSPYLHLSNFMSANHSSATAHFPMRYTMLSRHISTCVVVVTVRRLRSARTWTSSTGSLLPVILVWSRKALPRPVICLGAGCNVILLSIQEQGRAHFGALRREFTTLFLLDKQTVPLLLPHANMSDVQEGLSDVPSPSLRAAPTYEQHKGKGTSRKDSSRTGMSSIRQESSGRELPHGVTSGSQGGDVYLPSPTVSRPSTSWEEACAPAWNMVMEVLAELRGDLEEMKKERNKAPGGGGVASHVVNTPHSVDSDGDSQDDLPTVSVLRQCAKSYGPVDEISDGIDKHVADKVNRVFDCGICEDEYKEIMEADVVKRPSNCPALAPVECNTQVLDALKTDARKADFRMKGVSKDIVKAATIVTKSLTVLDKVA